MDKHHAINAVLDEQRLTDVLRSPQPLPVAVLDQMEAIPCPISKLLLYPHGASLGQFVLFLVPLLQDVAQEQQHADTLITIAQLEHGQ